MLSLDKAQAVLAAALEAAQTHGVAICAVVTDTGGHPVASVRMDGTSFLNLETARRKAVLAGAFATPSSQIQTMIGKDPVAGPVLQSDDRICLLPGGSPIKVHGVCVGGLGIAGAHYMQDQAVADYATVG